MTDEQWKMFLEVSADVIGGGSQDSATSASWCSWTTFRRLREDACYWAAGFPSRDQLHGQYVDEKAWGQYFHFSDLAHVIVPRTFYWESIGPGTFECGEKRQDIDLLSKALSRVQIPHRCTELVLEIKLF